MRYALISDVHGNWPALEAVLGDARAQNVDGYWLLGDYVSDLPYPNEILSALFSLDNARMIRGNRDDYLVGLRGRDPSTFTDTQNRAYYWNLQAARPAHIDGLARLGGQADFLANGRRVRLLHRSRALFKDGAPFSQSGLSKMGSRAYAEWNRDGTRTHADFLADTQSLLGGDEPVADLMRREGLDIAAFGHSHCQWHARVHGALLINPGSCGMSLDFDRRAAYSIVDTRDLSVNERRVRYDVEGVAQALCASEFYVLTRIWSECTLFHIRAGIEVASFFLEHVERIARTRGHTARPHADGDWVDGWRAWRADPRYAELAALGEKTRR